MISLPSSSLRRNLLAVWATTTTLALMLPMVVFVDAGAILGEQRLNKVHKSSRSLSVENLSGRKADMFWVNTFQDPEAFVGQFIEDGKSTGCAYGADKSISSYAGHQFEIRELPGKKTGSCVYNECRKVRYKMTDRYDQKIIINPDFTLTIKDDKERAYTKADDMFTRCQEKSERKKHHPLDSIELITRCMEEEISGKVKNDRDERSFHSKVHRNMAVELVPFTCGDVNKTESLEIKNTTWVDKDGDQIKHLMKVLHKLPTSDIFVVDDFVSQETCDALKIYRQKVHDGDMIGVPTAAATEETKQSDLLLDLYYKMYAIIRTEFKNWKELNFEDEMLFEYIKDPVGFKTPSHLCTTQEDVNEAVAEIEAGKPKKCLIPGGVPEAVPTKHVVVEDGITEEEKKEKRQLAQLFLFCDEPKQQLGGIQFPYAAVHTTPKVGKLVVAVHRHPDDTNHRFDGYVNEYHMCPNHEVSVHTVVDHDPAPVNAEGEDEGEL
jgi:hypothetical protein